jgi:hypothetical protein
VVYDRTANTLKWFLNDGSEVGNGVDLSTYSGQFFATGK